MKKILMVSLLALTACGGGSDTGAGDGYAYPARGVKYSSATTLYGPLVVRDGSFSKKTSTIPWVGYWLPTNQTFMFEGSSNGLSPLEKYDLYAKKAHGMSTHAAEYERNNLYDEHAAGSDGHCDALSIASIFERDPTPGGWQNAHSVTLNGVTFTPGDIKALTVDIYEKYDLVRVVGEKYRDTSDDINDIYPDQFHRVLQAELFDRDHPVIMNKSPSFEVWNSPIDGVFFDITADNSNSHLMHVVANVQFISGDGENAISRDPYWVGNPLNAEFNKTYTYDLLGEYQSDGSFLVKSGIWTGSSTHDHPDFVSVEVAGAQHHSSLNPEVKNDLVYEIIHRAQAGH